MTSDFKPRPTIRDKELLRQLHSLWRDCALCGNTDRLSLHHIHKHPRDDVQGNLVMLCGDGVRGCHGLIESHHGPTERALMRYILNARPDTINYLAATMGPAVASEWIQHRMS